MRYLTNRLLFPFHRHCKSNHSLQQYGPFEKCIIKRLIYCGQTMTSHEVATALRPFIFNIHPDRFWNFPNEKSTNEISLKKLNGFLDDKLNQKLSSNEETVTFYYMRNTEKCSTKSVDKIKLTKVDIKLNKWENLNTTVHR